MQKLCLILFLTFNACLFAQTYGPQQVKSFYYDVDNFSLTPESMKLLASFVNEIKTSPIEIIQIVGYVEKEGNDTYNKIKSKKRMEKLKQSLDTALVIQQYQPLNLDFAPAFLYSYDDGYNFRRVDITYRHVYIFKAIPINPQDLKKMAQKESRPSEKDSIQNKSSEFSIESNDGTVIHYQSKESTDLTENLSSKNNNSQENLNNNQKSTIENSQVEQQNGLFSKLFKRNKNQETLNATNTKNDQAINNVEVNDSISSNSISKKENESLNNSSLANNNISTSENGTNSEVNTISPESSFENSTNTNNKTSLNEVSNTNNSLEEKKGFLSNLFRKNKDISYSDSTKNVIPNEIKNNSIKDSIDLNLNSDNKELENKINTDKTIENTNLNTDINTTKNNVNNSNNESKEIDDKKSRTSTNEKSKISSEDTKKQQTKTVHKNYTEKKVETNTSTGKKSITIIETKENQNVAISRENKTQDEIDNLVVRTRNQKIETLDEQLERVNIRDLNESVVIITLNIQFVGNEPIITANSLKEMTNLFVFLQSNPTIDAFIRGHVCCGDEMGLSRKRAKHVYSELVKKGIDKDRLRHDGFSNTLPVVYPERNEADRSRNRRVDVILSSNKNRAENMNYDTTIIASNTENIEKESKATNVTEEKKEEVTGKKSLTSLTVELEDDMNGLINVEGRSQVEIDFLKVKAKKSKYKQGETTKLTLEQQLAKIDIRKLDKSIFLITLSIQFSNNKPILDDIANKELNDIFTFLYEYQNVNAFIRGHVCCGDEMGISKSRAKYIYKELIKRGIDKKRLRYQGFSNHLPLVFPERTDEDRNKNRRIDIILSK